MAGTPAAFTPTGTVTYEFFTNGTGSGTPASTQTVTLNANGTVPDSAVRGPLAAGAYSFITVYSGDSNYKGSTSPVEPLTINQGSTGTATAIRDAATSQPPSGVLGESVFDTATVTANPAAFTPTGTVTYQFFTNGTGSGTPAVTQTVTLNANGTVPNSVVHGPLAAGAYSFIAVYSGDSNYTGSTSSLEPLTISQGSTATATAILDAATRQAPSGILGESVFDTATVTGSPAAFTPTGTVTYRFFTNGSGTGVPVATQTVTLNADGTVPDSAVHGPLAAGAYSIIAVYSGDSNYTGSTSPVEPLTINQGSTGTATAILDAATNQPPSGVLGESLFDTATVTASPAAFTPRGTVMYEFFTNGTGSGTPAATQTVTLNADGTVPNSEVRGPLAAGAYSFVAVYSGDSNYTGSTSPVEPLTISQGSTTTATEILNSTRGRLTGMPGELVFDTATVTGSPAAFTATGTVTYQFFTNGSGSGTPTSTQTVTLNADGTVPDSEVHGPLAAGVYSFVAVYSGDSNYTGSTSPVEPLTIGTGISNTATNILDATTRQAPSGILGESVLDTATVTVSPTAFTPTGTVTYEFFTNGSGSGTPAATQTVTLNPDGTVPDSAVRGPLAAGAYSFIAVYSGDHNYQGSTSGVEPLTISRGSTGTATAILDAATSAPPSGVLGESVFDTATVAGTPAAFTPTGTVTYEFFTNGTGSGTPASTQTVTLNANGTVPDSAVRGPLAAGAYSFITVYSGDSNYKGSTSLVEPLTINHGSTGTATAIRDAATSQPPSGVLGESVFDTATVAANPAAFTPTGTVTYEFFTNGTGTGTPASTQTVTLNANGTVPDSEVHGPLQAGAYSFIAIYSGDSNYTASTSAVEPLTVNKTTPTITTTPNSTTVTLGPTAPPILTDTAMLVGGYHPTGTITFTLFHNGGTLPPDRHHHLHAVPQRRHHAGGLGNSHGQRQRHLHDHDRLHAAGQRHGDRYLSVGRHLPRRPQQQDGQRHQSRQRAGGGQSCQPDDHHDSGRTGVDRQRYQPDRLG